jgi:hypothetical protein
MTGILVCIFILVCFSIEYIKDRIYGKVVHNKQTWDRL